MLKDIQSKLTEITGKSTVVLTRRGNKALKFTLKALKELGLKKILIQDQGGWLTYPQYAEELEFELVKIKTDYGLINLEELNSNVDDESIILINSMPGYSFYENMEKIEEIAQLKGAVLVNDVSGSIGTDNAKIGDVIFGSFGKWKPIDLGYGGFIATDGNYLDDMRSVFDEKWNEELMKKFEGLQERINSLKEMAKKVKQDLKEHEIIHAEKEGFNVIVKFSTEEEKEKILNYCEKENFEFTICPRYIRVNEDAVCIEVKRK